MADYGKIKRELEAEEATRMARIPKRKVTKVRSRKRVAEVRLTRKVTLRSALALLSYERPYNVKDADDDFKF